MDATEERERREDQGVDDQDFDEAKPATEQDEGLGEEDHSLPEDDRPT